MDQEKELQEISEIEEIKQMLIGVVKTQEMMLERLEQMGHLLDRMQAARKK